MSESVSKEKLKLFVEKIQDLIFSDQKDLLEAVKLKGDDYGFYYAPQSKGFVQVHRNSEMYIIPAKLGEKDKVYIYVIQGLFSGEIITADEDEVIHIGFN